MLTSLQTYLAVAFDNAELRALNAVNIDCDITFMQVPQRFVRVASRAAACDAFISVPRVPCRRGKQDGKIRCCVSRHQGAAALALLLPPSSLNACAGGSSHAGTDG